MRLNRSQLFAYTLGLPLSLSAVAAASKLFVGSNSGKISTLEFTHGDASPELKLLHFTNVSFPAPSWQELAGDILYTVEETTTYSSGGGIRSYRIAQDGNLQPLYTANSLPVPVSLAVDKRGEEIFTANYVGAGVCTYIADPDTGHITLLSNYTYTLTPPVAVPERQDTPHPHQALFDPTGRFTFVPDLGADMVRVYKLTTSYTSDAVEITDLEPIKTKPGMGPRHGLFWPKQGKAKYYYLVGELDNSIVMYSVEYLDGGEGIKLEEIQALSTFPANASLGDVEPFASEVVISPDFTNLYVANRNDRPAFFPTDSLAIYKIDQCTGKLTFQALTPSGVFHPRHFTMDPTGEWVFVAGQDSGNVVVLQRNLFTGELSGPVAEWTEEKVEGRSGPVCVTWWK